MGQEFYQNDSGMTEDIIVKPASQAIIEKNGKVAYEILGEQRVSSIKPIEDCCSHCDFWQHKDKFKSIKDCQQKQKREAAARGFTEVICPRQFN